MYPGVSGVYNMEKKIFICDINTCEAETSDGIVMENVIILGMMYHLCKSCLESFMTFVTTRLENGRFPISAVEPILNPSFTFTQDLGAPDPNLVPAVSDQITGSVTWPDAGTITYTSLPSPTKLVFK